MSLSSISSDARMPVVAATPSTSAVQATFQQLSPTSWVVTRGGRIAGSISRDGDYLVFDADGMLLDVVDEFAVAARAFTITADQLSYSTRRRVLPVAEKRTRRLRITGVAALTCGLVAPMVAAVVHPGWI